MMKLILKALLVALIQLIGCLHNYAQKEPKWGKVSQQEIDYKVCSFDSLADAVILSEYCNIQFVNGFAHIAIHKRIKVLTKEGTKYANIQVPFYGKKNFEQIKNIEAQTINIIDKKVETQELNSKDIFTTNVTGDWGEIRFAFPSVKPGAILEYKYTLVTQLITFLDAWKFQHEIPVLYSQVKAEIPEYLRYSIYFIGDKVMDKYNNKPNKENLWALSEIPGYKQEHYVYCIEDYINKIQFQLLSYEAFESGAYSKGLHEVKVLQDWPQLAEEISEKYLIFLMFNKSIREIIDGMVKKEDKEDEKIKKIFEYVKQEFKWDREFSIIPELSKSEVIKNKRGNTAEINLLLITLLSEAGFDAKPLLISTRKHGKMVKNFPILEQFNSLITIIKKDGTFLPSDPTDENLFIPYNLLPSNDLNYYGFLLDGKNSKWIDLPSLALSRNGTFVNLEFNKTNVNLEVNQQPDGYFASRLRNKISNRDNPAKEIIILGNNLSLKLDSVKNNNIDNIYTPLSSKAFYSTSECRYNEDLQISQNFIEEVKNEFNQTNRAFPVEFEFPFSRQIVFTIKLPETHEVSSIPSNKSVRLPNNSGSFIYSVSTLTKSINIIIKWEITKNILPKDYYEYLREFYNQIISKLNEPILLTRKK